MMTPDEMRQEANMLESIGSKGRTEIWRSTAEICERLESITELLDRVVVVLERVYRNLA